MAVKRLKEIARDIDENSVLEFQREIEVNMSLRHKNIVYFFGELIKCKETWFAHISDI